jgi:hypothetical protein
LLEDASWSDDLHRCRAGALAGPKAARAFAFAFALALTVMTACAFADRSSAGNANIPKGSIRKTLLDGSSTFFAPSLCFVGSISFQNKK